jgi:hypothetical protein
LSITLCPLVESHLANRLYLPDTLHVTAPPPTVDIMFIFLIEIIFCKVSYLIILGLTIFGGNDSYFYSNIFIDFV